MVRVRFSIIGLGLMLGYAYGYGYKVRVSFMITCSARVKGCLSFLCKSL